MKKLILLFAILIIGCEDPMTRVYNSVDYSDDLAAIKDSLIVEQIKYQVNYETISGDMNNVIGKTYVDIKSAHDLRLAEIDRLVHLLVETRTAYFDTLKVRQKEWEKLESQIKIKINKTRAWKTYRYTNVYTFAVNAVIEHPFDYIRGDLSLKDSIGDRVFWDYNDRLIYNKEDITFLDEVNKSEEIKGFKNYDSIDLDVESILLKDGTYVHSFIWDDPVVTALDKNATELVLNISDLSIDNRHLDTLGYTIQDRGKIDLAKKLLNKILD